MSMSPMPHDKGNDHNRPLQMSLKLLESVRACLKDHVFSYRTFSGSEIRTGLSRSGIQVELINVATDHNNYELQIEVGELGSRLKYDIHELDAKLRRVDSGDHIKRITEHPTEILFRELEFGAEYQIYFDDPQPMHAKLPPRDNRTLDASAS